MHVGANGPGLDESMDDEDREELLPEDQVHIEDCTCKHDPDEHGWGECLVEGCPCEGGWTE